MNKEEIKTDHFKTMEELLEHLKMWERDDDCEAYCRFFDYECAYEMAHYIDKLQKENEELKTDNKALCEMAFIKPMPLLYATPEFTSTDDFISIDEIKQLVGYEENEDVSKDEVISLLKTMWEEFNRLEDIEYYYKKGDKWYAHYKETQVDKTKAKELEEQAKSKVTEKELKDMIIGMLE